MEGLPNGLGACGQCGPKCVAASGALQGATGAGGFQRSAPTGGAAYGIPKYSSSLPDTKPVTGPLVV